MSTNGPFAILAQSNICLLYHIYNSWKHSRRWAVSCREFLEGVPPKATGVWGQSPRRWGDFHSIFSKNTHF